MEGISKRESAAIREPLARTRSPAHHNNNHDKKPIPIKPKEAKPTNNPLWDVLCEVFYTPTTKAECSNFGKIVRELKAVDATPEDVRYRVRQHALRQNHWDMTPNALLPHWTELGTKNGKAASNNGTTQQSTLDPTQDPERLKRYARLVQQRGQRQVTG